MCMGVSMTNCVYECKQLYAFAIQVPKHLHGLPDWQCAQTTHGWSNNLGFEFDGPITASL